MDDDKYEKKNVNTMSVWVFLGNAFLAVCYAYCIVVMLHVFVLNDFHHQSSNESLLGPVIRTSTIPEIQSVALKVEIPVLPIVNKVTDKINCDGMDCLKRKIDSVSSTSTTITPVLGPNPVNGASPLYGIKHQSGNDAVFALACKYSKEFFQRFVGSLRKFGYPGDIVLAVSPPDQMKPGVGEYLRAMNVAAYAFDVDCITDELCKLRDEFLGYPDPRPPRRFSYIRYALYEYWMRYYSEQSYILILDFRDTFFQADPFASFGYPVSNRIPKYDLQVYAENEKVKWIGKCKWNSKWISKCFSPEDLVLLKDLPVICSGSTLGSYRGVNHYLKAMLTTMDRVQCYKQNIESDQGYQNYLFHNGLFNTKEGNATMNLQGNGVVNTIGAMNGPRVPLKMRGPLDTFWKIRDSEGYILNYDGTKSACVHQWDRFGKELKPFVDSGKLYDL